MDALTSYLPHLNSLASVVRLVLAVWLFSRMLPHRDHFALRVMITLAVVAALTVAALVAGFSIFPEVSDAQSFYLAVLQFVILLAVTTVGASIPYEMTLWTSLYCSASAYALQSLAGGLDRLCSTLAQDLGGPVMEVWFAVAELVVVTAVSYGLCQALLVRRLEADRLAAIQDRMMLLVMAVVILFDIVFDLVVRDLATYDISRYYFVTLSLTQVVACVLTLVMEYEILYNRRMEIEVATTERLRQQQARQYAISRETIEAINARCHHIRHALFKLIRDAGVASHIGPDVLFEVAREINVYDASVRTGNDALDTVLTEKRLLCQNEGITLTCIADGSALGFMSPTDTYILFGELLDKAMASLVNAKGERTISLTVRGVGDMVAIHEEHEGGAGTRSRKGLATMRAIAHSYGGSFETSHAGDVRMTDVLLHAKRGS